MNSLKNNISGASTTDMDKKCTVVYKVDGNEIRLIPSIVQDYIVGKDSSKITLQEYKFFAELCKARGLNPFLREAYCIKYGDKPAQIVVGKDAIVKRAVLHPQYDGMESGIFVETANGEIKERSGTFYAPSEKVVGGWARVYRKDWTHPIYSSVSFNEAAQHKSDGGYNSNWSAKGATMIEKVAKVRALREAFVEQLGGMYEPQEFAENTVDDNGNIIMDSEPAENQHDANTDDYVDGSFDDNITDIELGDL